MKAVEYRIDTERKWMMLSLAGFFDLLQFVSKILHIIPIVGNISALLFGYAISGLAGFTFYLWFKLRGISIFGGSQTEKKVLGAAMSLLIEMTPIVNALPAWTFFVLRTIALSRTEDILKQQKSAPSKPLATPQP